MPQPRRRSPSRGQKHIKVKGDNESKGECYMTNEDVEREIQNEEALL